MTHETKHFLYAYIGARCHRAFWFHPTQTLRCAEWLSGLPLRAQGRLLSCSSSPVEDQPRLYAPALATLVHPSPAAHPFVYRRVVLLCLAKHNR